MKLPEVREAMLTLADELHRRSLPLEALKLRELAEHLPQTERKTKKGGADA